MASTGGLHIVEWRPCKSKPKKETNKETCRTPQVQCFSLSCHSFILGPVAATQSVCSQHGSEGQPLAGSYTATPRFLRHIKRWIKVHGNHSQLNLRALIWINIHSHLYKSPHSHLKQFCIHMTSGTPRDGFEQIDPSNHSNPDNVDESW